MYVMVILYTGIQVNTYYDWYIFNLDQLVTNTIHMCLLIMFHITAANV